MCYENRTSVCAIDTGEKNFLKYPYLGRKMDQKRFLPTGLVNHQTSGIGGRLSIPAEAQGERGPLRL